MASDSSPPNFNNAQSATPSLLPPTPPLPARDAAADPLPPPHSRPLRSPAPVLPPPKQPQPQPPAHAAAPLPPPTTEEFCLSCLCEAHSPCSCPMREQWLKKCVDESQTINYISVNTKPCPKCNKLVEKNGGCNLVTCVCGQPFCWLCGAPTGSDHTWDSIVGH